jgi:hypothetical protein
MAKNKGNRANRSRVKSKHDRDVVACKIVRSYELRLNLGYIAENYVDNAFYKIVRAPCTQGCRKHAID